MNADFGELVMDYLTGNLSGERAGRFLEMIDNDKECAKRFDELNRLYAASLMPRYEADRKGNWKKLNSNLRRRGHSVSGLRWLYVAAALLVGVVSGLSFRYFMNDEVSDEVFCDIVVPNGSRTSLMLPDSSTVWLNSGSRLSYSKDFGRENREISLCGEAYFEVSRDEKHPFIVDVNSLQIKVLGTTFNVCAEENSGTATVDLIKGKVEVTADGGDQLVLFPGQRAVLDRSTGALSSTSSEPFVSDWVYGRLSFVNIPVTEIFERLQKHFNVRIDINDDRLAEEYFTGSIDLNLALDEILEYLDVDNKYAVTMKGGIIEVSAKKK